MQCPRCQQENPSGQQFCGECGARLEARCPACGTVNSPGQKFCGECGEPLTAGPSPAQAASPSPESYTPRHLAERILTSKSALEGERKQVTVLFADLKGSLELLADRDPEEARRLLDPVLERMMEAVHRYEGTVNQVMGDGIMALFGAAGPRGPRRARLLRRAGDAGAGDALRGGRPLRPRRERPDPGRAELGRGRRPLDRKRPPYGLHRRWAHDPSGGPDGAAGQPGQRCTCSATSRPIPTASMPRAARPASAGRWRSRDPAACGRSSPTATSASASSRAHGQAA